MRTHRQFLIICGLVAAICLTCAHHPTKMHKVRALMTRGDYGRALEEFLEIGGSEGDALYLLEKGLLLHYVGEYQQSNEVFDRAEILSEDLYTKSISREAAALLTSDLALEYVPKPFEQVLINYFRALNYTFLGMKEDALVECRKASDKLALYSEEDKRPYRRDAFIERLTGILYEWDGDINDAFISYRNAISDYHVYSDVFGIPGPDQLTCDVLRTASAIGFTDEVSRISDEDQRRCAAERDSVDLAKVVVFIEQGFVPPKEELAVNVPILKSEAKKTGLDPFAFSLGIHSRIYGHAFDTDDIAYFLRVAVPWYPDRPAPRVTPVLYLDSLAVRASLSEDIFAISKAEHDHDMPKIVAKTLARALIKYKASDKAEDKWGKLAGTLVNLAAAATEQADLRGWLSLPRAIYTAVLYVEPGTHVLALDAPALHGASEIQWVGLEARAGGTSFIRFRTYDPD
jgi:hypothetical protein